MRKVWEFEQHAEECRMMAAQTRDQNRKRQLLELAEAWEVLAQVRAKGLGRSKMVRPVNSRDG